MEHDGYRKGDVKGLEDIGVEHSGLFKLKERGKYRYIKRMDISERIARSFACKKSTNLTVLEEA